jgi:predicted RNase H-like nuclease
LLTDKEYRVRIGLEREGVSYQGCRTGEYELRRRKITLYNTPVDAESAPSWMQTGWHIYDALRKHGFVDYPKSGNRRVFETYPHGSYTALIKHKPYPKSSVRGLLQRQLILYDEGVGVPDPMDILEEWTRHRIMTGQLENKGLFDHDQLDAVMAAYTAFLVAREPHNTIAVGDLIDGQIVLPVPELLDGY